MEGKPWTSSRADIERTLSEMSGDDHDLLIKLGLQLRATISHYPSPVFSSAYHKDLQTGIEMYAVNYLSMDGGESAIALWHYNSDGHLLRMCEKFVVRNCLRHLLWIPNQHAYIGYCDDMTLRGFVGESMVERVRISVPNSVVCIFYLEDWDELLTAGQGHLISWRVQQIAYSIPFRWKEPQIRTEINDDDDIWITRLSYVKSVRMLMALSDNGVYMINMRMRQQVDYIPNTHDASLTNCAFYPKFYFVITAARDGSIHVYHAELRAVIHTFPAHIDGLTGVECLSNEPILISWSHATGCARMWRLDTLELTNESSLSEGVVALWFSRPDRMYYQTESELRIFDVNATFRIFTSLSAPSVSFKLCWIAPGDADQDAASWASSVSKSESQDVSTGDKKIYNRLICVLDDGCLITLSPVTGLLVHVVYPMSERSSDKEIMDFVLTANGESCSLLMNSGDVFDFDCTTNPGHPRSQEALYRKITSITMIEIECDPDEDKAATLDLASEPRKLFCAVLLGCDNGNMKLHSDVSYMMDSSDIPVTMEPVKIHTGSVVRLYAPSEKQTEAFTTLRPDTHSPWLSSGSILFSLGTDRMICIWQVYAALDEYIDVYGIHLIKLNKIRMDVLPSFIIAIDAVLLVTYDSGAITMHKMRFRIPESDDDASKRRILLDKIDRIPTGVELHHKAKVISVAHSEILKLFVTCGKCELIKIWDLEGRLIREFDLGDTVTSVCFSNGRDILLSYRSHIVLIEAHRYLPLDYLDELLEFDEQHGIKDIPSEDAIPVEGGVAVGAFAIKPGVFEKYEQVKFDPGSKKEDAKSARSLRRKAIRMRNRRRASLGQHLIEEIEEDDEADEVTEKKIRTDEVLIRPVDPFMPEEYIIERMKICPIAPDGYIPNSTIRRKVKYVYADYPDDFIDLLGSGDRTKKTSVVQYGGGDSMISSSQSVLTDLKRRNEKDVTLWDACSKLVNILERIAEEDWCTVYVNFYDLEHTLLRISRLLEDANEKDAMKIFSAMLEIQEECRNLSLKWNVEIEALGISTPGMPHSAQQKLAINSYPYLFHENLEVRTMAGRMLASFHFTVIHDFIVHYIGPALTRDIARSPNLNVGKSRIQKACTTALAAVAIHTNIKSIESVSTQIEKVSDERNPTSAALEKQLRKDLVREGIPFPSATLWASCVARAVTSKTTESEKFPRIQQEKLGFPSPRWSVPFSGTRSEGSEGGLPGDGLIGEMKDLHLRELPQDVAEVSQLRTAKPPGEDDLSSVASDFESHMSALSLSVRIQDTSLDGTQHGRHGAAVLSPLSEALPPVHEATGNQVTPAPTPPVQSKSCVSNLDSAIQAGMKPDDEKRGAPGATRRSLLLGRRRNRTWTDMNIPLYERIAGRSQSESLCVIRTFKRMKRRGSYIKSYIKPSPSQNSPSVLPNIADASHQTCPPVGAHKSRSTLNPRTETKLPGLGVAEHIRADKRHSRAATVRVVGPEAWRKILYGLRQARQSAGGEASEGKRAVFNRAWCHPDDRKTFRVMDP